MSFFIKGETRPIIGKNVYVLMYTKQNNDQVKKGVQLYVNDKADVHKNVDGSKIVKQQWKLLKNGKLFFDLGTDGKITFSQASLGSNYTIVVDFSDSHGAQGTAKLNITPVAGTPSIENLKWQDEYYRDLEEKKIGYSDNVRLFIHTLNIPVGDRLDVTIWEDEGTDGHGSSSRNMGTYKSSPVDKYGKTEIYFNNIKVYQKILNDKDFRDENEHEFYAQVKYKGKIDTYKDTIQLKIVNDLKKMVEPPKNNSVVKVSAPYKQKKPENKIGVKVTLNVFFDGTKNNMKNTQARLAYEKKKKGIILTPEEEIGAKAFVKNKEEGSSYDNYFSNVAIMKTINIMDLNERIIPIYIEGEGTTNEKKDDTMGYAFGSGDVSGIPVKVRKAFNQIQTEIDSLKKKKYITSNQFINEIDVNVIGFSRGATAARHFLSQRRKLQDLYNIESNKFIINFVGLFDTVSSYEEEGRFAKVGSGLSHNFDNDVEELKLKLEGNVKKVFHLTAYDEYRYNFSLTNIKSSIDAGIGYELSIPGVHSDIGGGYAEIENERRRLHLESGYNNIKETLIKEGWYDEKQIVTTTVQSEGYPYTTHMANRTIPFSYQFIPLAIMVSLAEKYKLKFEKKDIETKGLKYSVPEDLADTKELLLNFALANDGAHSKAVTLKTEKLHFVRKKYLHRSTYDGLGMEGRYKEGKPSRKIIEG
ncbi:hypothetical protein L1276_004206 [Flavobacterium sp. HSC-32F16]|uniref:phospholipase effector Tle1 domain-containing protein n=1 Tax=Flavobacterium sp. HSC-32F16 TaxID=2910964 RepID=UPI0020A46E21|nr:DUF2235 domain-containing protein [Flavobacterium sp. HSC-32F16]MCP2029027.1 hypothetical protein [Flavobacterium sp. HSC-32F16]